MEPIVFGIHDDLEGLVEVHAYGPPGPALLDLLQDVPLPEFEDIDAAELKVPLPEFVDLLEEEDAVDPQVNDLV